MRWIWVGLLVVTLILVPFFLFEDYFNQLSARITSGETSPVWASAAIASLLASDVVLPIPSSIISAAAGALLGWWRGAAMIWVGMMGSCVIGYWLVKHDFEPAPMILGFVLGPLMEENLRRAMLIARGDATVFLTRPISAALLAISALMLILAVLPTLRSKRDEVFTE